MFDAPPPDYADLARTERWLARASTEHLRGGSLEDHREVSGKRAYDALGALSLASHVAPHVAAQRRWVAFLTAARIAEPSERELEAAARAPEVELDLEEVRRVPWDEAWRELLGAASPGRAARILPALAARGPALAEHALRAEERRAEAAARLGGGHDPVADAARAPLAAVEEAARIVLERGAPLVADLLRAESRRREAPLGPEAFVGVALARAAGEGWPARLGRRWLVELFRGPLGELANRTPLGDAEVPAALGAASFARALERLGLRAKDAGAAASLPFSLARDPYAPRGRELGALLALLPASAAFERRALGLGGGPARDQARALGITALFELRRRALGALLASRPGDASRFEELSALAFGAPLPRGLVVAFPRLRGPAAHASFAAALRAAAWTTELVDRHDEDWFANPRAGADLVAFAALPARSDEARADGELSAWATLTCRVAEETLG